MLTTSRSLSSRSITQSACLSVTRREFDGGLSQSRDSPDTGGNLIAEAICQSNRAVDQWEGVLSAPPRMIIVMRSSGDSQCMNKAGDEQLEFCKSDHFGYYLEVYTLACVTARATRVCLADWNKIRQNSNVVDS